MDPDLELPQAGKLAQRVQAAGIDLPSVTDVVLTVRLSRDFWFVDEQMQTLQTLHACAELALGDSHVHHSASPCITFVIFWNSDHASERLGTPVTSFSPNLAYSALLRGDLSGPQKRCQRALSASSAHHH
jgi:hypothetical protein